MEKTKKSLFGPMDLTRGTCWKTILIFSLPVILSYLLQQVYSISDAAIVGQTLTAQEVAGVNDTSSLVFIFLQFAFGVSAGFCVVTSCQVGARNQAGVRRSLATQIVLSAVLTVLLTALALALLNPMLAWINVTPDNAEVYRAAYTYCFIIFAGIGAQLFYNFICAFLRSMGDSLTPLLFLLGMAWFNDWHAALYMPAFCAILVALFAFAMMRDTPQSCGLPPIEEYKNDYPDDYNEKAEQELTAKQIFMQYVLPNKLLWYIAIANVFVYLLRYGILDWSPTYLKEVKHFALDKSSWAYFLYEYAGIPGTLLCGWMSDKVFRGNRGATGVFFMTLVTIATIVYWMNPAGNPTVDMICMIVIGFLIYGPVMLIGLHALELAPKKAAGTAAGFTGLFGYLGGSVAASAIVGYTVDFFGWDGGFMVMIGGSILAVILLIVVMIGEKRRHEQLLQKRNGG